MNSLTPKGINHQSQKLYNRGLIFQLLATEPYMTRSELAQLSGLTKMTLSNIISDFIQKEYVVELAQNDLPLSPSNPAKIIFSPSAPKAVGIVIQREYVAASLCDLRLNILKSHKVLLKDFDEKLLMETVTNLADEMMENTNVLGIGISSVGPVDIDHGIILNPPDFHNQKNIHVIDYFRGYHVPVYLNHHLNSNALAEHFYGCGHRFHDFIFLSVDDGINVSIISGNQLYSNNTGLSSELGRFLVHFNPMSTNYYMGGQGEFIHWANCRDEEELIYSVDILSAVMSSICDLLNPQAIIVGGECSYLNNYHFQRMEKKINQRLMLSGYRHIPVIKAFRTTDLEASSSAVCVIQHLFNGDIMPS